MSITKRITSIIVSLTLVAVLVPVGNVQAITVEELKAQIAELTKQIAALQQQLTELEGTPTPPAVSACTITSFDRNLKQKMKGEDVKCLQILLNSDEETQVATTGAGSPGNETTYFGAKTKAAVIKFQKKHAEEILTPLGLTTGTGFVGPTTRAKLDALLAKAPAPTPACTTNADCPAGKTCQNGVCVVPAVLPSVGLTVTLAEDTPVTGTIVAGQATADLARFSFVNGDANPVKVTKIVLKRIGISGDDTLENVYLFEGNVRLTDAASVSQNTITFANVAGLFTVPAQGKVDVNVRADIKSGISGQTVGLQLTAATDITSDASAVNGVFPISANLMTIASAVLANADFTGTTLPGAGNIDPANDVMVWQRTLNVSNRDIYLNRIAFRQIGSINYADLKNFRLYIDGVQVGPAVENLDSNGYVTFVTSPYKLSTGSRVIKVIANVIGGSARTFSFSLRTIADIDLVDSSYNVNIRPTVNTTTFTSITAGIQTVNSGNVTVQKATDSPSGNVIIDGSDIVLAKFTLTAYGEPVKIETLTAGFTHTSGGNVATSTLRNGRLIANGSQVGSTATLSPGGTSFTTNLTVTPGTPVTLEIRADIYDNDGTGQIANGDTIVARLIAGTSNAQGTNSLTIINVPSTSRDGNTLTVASGVINLAKTSTYVDQSLVVPQTAFKLGSFVLSGNPTEDVNINTIQVDFTGTDAWTVSTLSDVYVKYGTYTTPVKPTVTATGNSWSVNYTLAKNAHLTIEVYANISADAYTTTTADTMTTSLLVTGVTAASGQTVNTGTTPLTGQTMTATIGQIVSAVDASTPVAKIVADNTTQDVAAFKFTTVNDSYTLTQMVVSVGSTANASAINNVILKDKATVVGTAPIVGTTATFSGLSVAMPANTSKVLTVSLELARVGVGGAPSGANVRITLDSFKANNSQGVENTFANLNQAANLVYVYKAIPTISNVALPSTVLTTGTITLAKFKIEATGDTIGWKKVIFNITKTGATGADDPEITSASLYDADTNAIVSGAVTLTNVGTSSTSGSITFVATTEQEVSGTKTYVLKATVAATALATGDNINTNIVQPSTYAAPANYATVAATTASFVWTDQSAASHSETTADWNNGYLVKNLPTDSQTLTK